MVSRLSLPRPARFLFALQPQTSVQFFLANREQALESRLKLARRYSYFFIDRRLHVTSGTTETATTTKTTPYERSL